MEGSGVFRKEGRREALSRIPLVELAGQNRVLVENHRGVLAYSLEEIQIKVSYGKITVVGCKLEIMQLNRNQLVICGQIDAVRLIRG